MTDELISLSKQAANEAAKAYDEGFAAGQAAALAEIEPEGPTVMEIIKLADEIEESGLGQVDLVRAALARWGRPAAQPEVRAVAPTPDDFRRWWRETGPQGLAPSPEMLLTANAWAEAWATQVVCAELAAELAVEAAEDEPPGRYELAVLPLPIAETPESKGSESSLSEFGPNDMPLG